jgi:hypothetical protein
MRKWWEEKHAYLSDDEAAALLRELDSVIEGDRYFLPPRMRTLKAIPCQNQNRSQCENSRDKGRLPSLETGHGCSLLPFDEG